MINQSCIKGNIIPKREAIIAMYLVNERMHVCVCMTLLYRVVEISILPSCTPTSLLCRFRRLWTKIPFRRNYYMSKIKMLNVNYSNLHSAATVKYQKKKWLRLKLNWDRFISFCKIYIFFFRASKVGITGKCLSRGDRHGLYLIVISAIIKTHLSMMTLA